MEDENDLLRITIDDIDSANQLSLACPICAGPVENSPEAVEMTPVICVDCDTLYHRTCWDQNGGKCAILGCTSTTVRSYGVEIETLTISMGDVPSEAEVSRKNKGLKRAERERMQRTGQQVQSPRSNGFWSDLFSNIARAFGFNRPR